ncbi:MAG: glutamyl-tRNA reductase [Chloroflexi bacterium]|nr:glutamyl-tRNA reductase [Chloroflexota bacterium]
MKILLIGLSHKTAPVEIRERLAFTPATLSSALTHFGALHPEAHLEEVLEGVILSTCNRLEVYALVGDADKATAAIINFLSQAHEIAPEALTEYLYIHHDEDAIRYLMRVAAGLASLVLGEPQILGQITAAYQAALAQAAAGTVLSALFRAAIHAGKQARTETTIGLNPASISSVAAGLAGKLLGDLSQRQVLLIGVGEMGAAAVKALIKRGVTQIVVANRTYERAVELAQTWGGQAITFQQLPTALAGADMVITATGAPHPILDRALLEPAMAARSERPLLIIDISVPRNVEADVAELSNVHLHNIDDLQGQADENVRERTAAIPQVESIVAEAVRQFLEWFSSLEVVSTLTALRQQAEQVRQAELERLFHRLDLPKREQELIAAMSQRLVNKMLHAPTLSLKKEAANGNGAAYLATARQLFVLDGSPFQDSVGKLET